MRLIFFFILALICGQIGAQNFEWESPIVMPDSSGFQKIYLTPEITSHLKVDFSDIRIYDNYGHEIPYLRRTEKIITDKNSKKKLSISSNHHNKRKGYTEIILKNTEKEPLTNISLTVENKEAEKWIKISGSNDHKKWFILKDKIVVPSQLSDSSSVEVLLLDFPVSNYLYYELIVHDYKNQPVIVSSAYRYNISIKNIKYTAIEAPHIEQHDTLENDKSLIYITFNNYHFIDKLKFTVEGNDYFLREARLMNIDSAMEKKIQQSYFNQLDQIFYLSSTEENILNLNKHRGKRFKLIIENKDDAPLVVKSVDAYQLSIYLIAYLKKGVNYVVRFGDPKLEIPIYDLRFFEDSIPENLITAATANIKRLRNTDPQINKGLNFNLIYLWGAIGIVTLLLVFISIRMFFELKNRT